MWTPEITRARYVEAAHTEQFLPTAKAPSAKGYWPAFFHDDEDKAGWDDAARLDNAEKSRGRASNGAISRHQECMLWTAERIQQDHHRHIVWSWAFCRANGWDFGSRCARRGWARPTAYRRLTAAIASICEGLNNDGVLLRLPDDKWLRHETPAVASISGTHEIHVTAPAIKFIPGYRTEKSRDLLTTPEAIAEFTKHRDRVNADRRRIQEREAKRREKLGAMGAA